MATLSIEQAAGLAAAVGFRGNGLVTILAIALAESGLNPAATNTSNNTPPSEDRGILQINSYWHPEVSDACAFDPACAFAQGFRISSSGSNFTPWSTYTNGDYQAHIAAVVAALAQPATKPLVLNHAGAVLDLIQSDQLIPSNESQDKCGPWTAAELKYAGLPNSGGNGTVAEIESFAHNEYQAYIGPDVVSDQGGSSIDDMHHFFLDAGNLHYWDIAAINATSAQSSDLANLHAAVGAGYPVAMTVAEQSVISKRLGKCPYPWQPALGNVNHIFSLVGFDSEGDLIVADQLNSFEPWPAIYKASVIDCSWASIVQVVGPDGSKPWLAAIPNGIPTSWPAGFNAQLFVGPGGIVWVSTSQMTQAEQIWNSNTQGAIGGGNALADVGLFPKGQTPPYTTGIALAWQAQYAAGHNYGAPTSYEFSEVNGVQITDWGGNPITVQRFEGGRCEWSKGVPHWYPWA